MRGITKPNMFFVFVAVLALIVSIWGIGPSPAFAQRHDCWMTGGGSIFENDGPGVVYGGSIDGDGG